MALTIVKPEEENEAPFLPPVPAQPSLPEPTGGPQAMVDPLIDQFDLQWLIRNYWWKLMLAPAIGMVLAIAFYLTREPLFESSATILVDPSFEKIIQVEAVSGGSQTDEQALRSLEMAVVADSVVLRVVNALNLRGETGFLPEEMAERTDLSDKELLSYLKNERFGAHLVPETRLIEISVLDPVPERAQKIASAFTTEFQSYMNDQRRDEVLRARDGLRALSDDARLTALEAEERLKTFRKEHAGLPIEQDHDLFSARLTRVGEELNTVTLLRQDLESKVQVLQGMNPETEPMEVIEVAGYGAARHVGDLLNALSASRARFSAAGAEFGQLHHSYRAAEAEVNRNEEQLQQMARDIKESVTARYASASKQEENLKTQLNKLVADLGEVKALGSEFRALQQEVEREWLVHQNLQTRIGDSSLTSGNSQIATVVSEPMIPYQKAKPEPLMFVMLGTGLGGFISIGWLGLAILHGVPFTNPRQLEQRFGMPVVADWSEKTEYQHAGQSPALMQLLSSKSGATQVAAPGLPDSARTAAIRMARMSADGGRRTLLLQVRAGHENDIMRPTNHPNLYVFEVSPGLILEQGRFSVGLEELRLRYDNIFVESSDINDPTLTAFLSSHLDMDLIVVAKGVSRKQQVDDFLRRMTGPSAPPAGLIMIDKESFGTEEAL